jgi:hypothetical protein
MTTTVVDIVQIQSHPQVRFVSIETGERRACLVGGPQVWTVVEAWLAHAPAQRTVAIVADAVGLSTMMVDAALAYWADHSEEIDDILDRHRLAQDEALGSWQRRQALHA